MRWKIEPSIRQTRSSRPNARSLRERRKDSSATRRASDAMVNQTRRIQMEQPILISICSSSIHGKSNLVRPDGAACPNVQHCTWRVSSLRASVSKIPVTPHVSGIPHYMTLDVNKYFMSQRHGGHYTFFTQRSSVKSARGICNLLVAIYFSSSFDSAESSRGSTLSSRTRSQI